MKELGKFFKNLKLCERTKNAKQINSKFKRGVETISLSRRRFLGTATAGAVGSIPLVRTLEDFVNASPPPQDRISSKLITFNDALADISLREEYINQTIKAITGKEADEFFQNTYYVHGSHRNLDADKDTVFLSDGDIMNFGNGKKMDLYAFRRAFEIHNVIVGGNTISFKPDESKIRGRMVHEILHAEDYLHGMQLENGSLINRLNIHTINKNVVDFVAETRGFIGELESIRKLELKNPEYSLNLNYLMAHQADKLIPTTYLESLFNFAAIFDKFEKSIRPENIPLKDRVYIINQINQIQHKVPELVAFAKVDKLYKRFALR